MESDSENGGRERVRGEEKEYRRALLCTVQWNIDNFKSLELQAIQFGKCVDLIFVFIRYALNVEL